MFAKCHVLLGSLLLVAALGRAQEAGSGVEIVDQTNRGDAQSSSSLVWASTEEWVATLDGQSGMVYVFDLASGRLSRPISIGSGEYGSTIFAVPGKDQIVVTTGRVGLHAAAGQEISVYDVISGARELVLADSEDCTINEVSASEVSALCSKQVKSVLHPFQTGQKTWNVTTGRLIRDEKQNVSAVGQKEVRDGTLAGQTRMVGAARQMAAAIGHLGSAMAAVDAMYRFSITDTGTQKVLLEGKGQILALSEKAQTAVIMGSDGTSLIQVPSGNRIAKLIAGPGYPFYIAQRASGGSEYLLGGTTEELIDASTGAVKKDAKDLAPGGVVSPTGTRVAYAEGTAVLLVKLADTAQRQTLGNHALQEAAAPDLYKLAPAADPATLIKQAQQKMKDDAKEQAKKERKFEKTLPKSRNREWAQMEEDHQRELAKREESGNSFEKSGINKEAAKEYATKLFDSYTRFGGPVMIPPMPRFVDSGRMMAVLSADLSWSRWDIATGNRIPFKTVAIEHQRLIESVVTGSFKEDQIYDLMERSLTASGPVPPSDLRTEQPAASDAMACRSQSGDFLIDYRAELDKKKWKEQKHNVTSVVLRSYGGRSADLLAKNVDFARVMKLSQLEIEEPNHCAISDDGKYVVLEQAHEDPTYLKHLSRMEKIEAQLRGKSGPSSLSLYETASGRKVCELAGSIDLDTAGGNVIFGARTRVLAAYRSEIASRLTPKSVATPGISVWDTTSCQRLMSRTDVPGTPIGFSPDDQFLYVAPNSREPGEHEARGVDVVHVQSGKVAKFPDAIANQRFITTGGGGHLFLAADADKNLGFWSLDSGERLGSMRALQEDEWLVTTPSGYFDGSPRGWAQIAWRVPGKGAATQPGEIFFNEFYRPGLLAELLQGRVPKAPRNIDQVDRRQPSIRISAGATKTAARTVGITIRIEEAPADATHQEASGVRDVRLFRNGSLVKVWRGAAKLENGKATFQTEAPVASGANEFAAYAFNRDNVKTADASATVESTAPKMPGTAYIVTVGINEYENNEFNLKFAEPDANTLAETLVKSQAQVGSYQDFVQVKLLNKQATKANILLALSVLAGESAGALPAGVPPQLRRLRAAGPEDVVIVYFAGHGVAWDDRFYLVPHDLGYAGPRENLRSSISTVLKNSISDQELEAAFEPMQAGHSLLIIDACNSGKALESEETRRGPMNNRGLAQLAYEKGMYVLTAAQSYQAARESSRLGHGYLTYALAQEGMTSAADNKPTDGEITAMEWFDFASERVPQLQIEAMREASENGRQLVFDLPSASGGAAMTGGGGYLQTPRFYYRRDLAARDLVIARAAPTGH